MFFKEDDTLDKLEVFQKNNEMINPKEHNLKSYEKFVNNPNKEKEKEEQLKNIEIKHEEKKERLKKIEEVKQELIRKNNINNSTKKKLSDEELLEKIKLRKNKNYKSKETFTGTKELSEKDKLYKLIRQIIIGALIMLGISSLLELYFVNKAVKQTEPIMNNMNEMTNDIVKANKVMIDKLTKELQKH